MLHGARLRRKLSKYFYLRNMGVHLQNLYEDSQYLDLVSKPSLLFSLRRMKEEDLDRLHAHIDGRF